MGSVGWPGQPPYEPVVIDSLNAPALAEADFSVIIMASETAQQRRTVETEILGAWWDFSFFLFSFFPSFLLSFFPFLLPPFPPLSPWNYVPLLAILRDATAPLYHTVDLTPEPASLANALRRALIGCRIRAMRADSSKPPPKRKEERASSFPPVQPHLLISYMFD